MTTLTVLQGAYYLATGVWPLVSRRSFERVTGPKTDRPEVAFLGAASAAGLGAIDVVHAARGRGGGLRGRLDRTEGRLVPGPLWRSKLTRFSKLQSYRVTL